MGAVPDELSGNMALTATMRVGSSLVDVSESNLQVAQLHVRSGSYVMDEPQLQLTGDCRWDVETGTLTAGQLQLVTSTVAMRTRNLSIGTNPSPNPSPEDRGGGFEKGSKQLEARGDVAFRADMERLAAVLGWVGGPSATWPRGMASGQLQFSTAQLSTGGSAPQLDLSIALDQLQIIQEGVGRREAQGASSVSRNSRLPTPNSQLLWTEPRVDVAAKLTYDPAADQLRLDDMRIASQALKLQGSATVDKLTREGDPRVVGRWELAGGSREFRIEKLAPPNIQPPTSQWYLLLPQGPLVTNMRISPEVSEKLLKYIAPVVAGATRADGLFSVQLEGARIPLVNPQQADITGRLAIHQLNVSPGPMVQEMVTLVEQIEAIARRRPQALANSRINKNAVTIDNRSVDFRVVDGRAYHRGLEFLVDGVPVRSSGSVGFDQTLAITLEVPIQDKWVERERALQPLAGQVLQLPIHGTFQKPRIDQRAVADLSRRMFQGVAERAIGDEINKQLNKLLRPR